MPTPVKLPTTQKDPQSVSRMRPVWQVAAFDVDGPWGVDAETASSWRQIFNKLRSYESMTWGQIDSDRKYNHHVSTQDLIKRARDRLVEIKLDDTESLFRFRFSGTKRLWGIRDRQRFKILWWDPGHEVCPSTKKHT